jgi:hypothetical protein
MCHDYGLLGGRGRDCGSGTELFQMDAKIRPTTITRSKQRVIVAHHGVVGPPAGEGGGERDASTGSTMITQSERRVIAAHHGVVGPPAAA